MESFYEAPRRPPVPTDLGKFQAPRAPLVPDVSLICNGNSSGAPNLATAHCQTGQLADISKKQVRFDSPVRVQSGTSYKEFKKSFDTVQAIKENVPVCETVAKRLLDLRGKTFEQIYMANIPNRHLDLSLLEQPNQPQNVAEAAEKDSGPLLPVENTNKHTNSHTVAYNGSPEKEFSSYRSYRLRNPAPAFTAASPPRRHNDLQPYHHTELRCRKSDGGDEPTMKDLLKIIQQQNEQIMMLQKQVSDLTNCVKESQNHPQDSRVPFSPRKNHLSKLAFDVKATSFEFSIRPQCNKFRRQHDFAEPKIQEVLEVDSSREADSCGGGDGLGAQALDLQDLQVEEPCHSPEQSAHIDMDKYESSDEESSGSTAETDESFCNDLMQQINNVMGKANILNNVQMQQNGGECRGARGRAASAPNRNYEPRTQTVRQVREATFKHLRSMGVDLPQTNDDSRQNEDSSETTSEQITPSELSCEVKQLLMKYLPDDYLAKMADQKPHDNNNFDSRTHRQAVKKVKGVPPELSIGAVEYMRKYNLICTDKSIKPSRKREFPHHQKGGEPPRILNVSTLKLQPKLL